MIELARNIITQAANQINIPLIFKPGRQTKILAIPRLEFDIVSSDENRVDRLFCKLRDDNNSEHITHRIQTHEINLQTRCEIKVGKNQIDTFADIKKEFLQAIPRKTMDNDNNLVVINLGEAKYSGFEWNLVNVLKNCSVAYWIKFKGGLYIDKQVPLIRDVNLKDGVTYEKDKH